MKYILFLSLSLLFSLTLLAQNDTLILANNDKIIGDIKEMDQGVIVVETDYSSDDFKIKWKQVKSVRSLKQFVVMLDDGSRLQTSLLTPESESGNIALAIDSELTIIPLIRIVYIKEFNSSFFSRLDGSFSVGYNYTKNNSLSQFSFIGNFGYIADRWNLSSDINLIVNSQKDADKTRRTSANVGSRYFLGKEWFTSLKIDFLSNDEQKLKLRTNIQAGAGNYIQRTNRWYLAAGLGIAYNLENYTGDVDPNQRSFEAFLIVESNVFDIGDLDVFANVTGYPSLTEKKRFRSDINITAKYSLPYDLFIKLDYTFNYDSKPITGASSSDYVFQTSFGWSPD